MKIVDPNNEIHAINLLPRFTPFGVIELFINNESQEVIYIFEDGFLNFSFEKVFNNKDRVSFYLKNNNEILYRGKIYATSSDTQNYKQIESVYEY